MRLFGAGVLAVVFVIMQADGAEAFTAASGGSGGGSKAPLLPPASDVPPPSRDAPLVDVRGAEAFEKGHVAGSTCIPLPELRERSYELPAPFEAPLRFCASSTEDLSEAHRLVEDLGWSVLPSFTVSPEELPAVPGCWRGVEWVAGSHSTACWRPSSFLERCVREQGLSRSLGGTGSQESLKQPNQEVVERPQVALDLGCGSGRDAVFLAQALGPSWTVVGVDNHAAALERAERLAAMEGVSEQTEWRCVDLRKQATRDAFAQEYQVDLVHGCRFLDRRLISLARDSLLRPGGLFVWSTFMEGEENLAPPFRPSRRLFPGELRHIFTGPDCSSTYELVYDEAGVLNTRKQDVPASFFAARRAK